MSGGLQIIPVHGLPEVRPGDVVADLLVGSAELADGDVVVVTSKIVSKAEGRLVELDPDDEGAHARMIEGESVRVLRRRRGLIISETAHGFVCASAGIDRSNVEEGWACLLPADPDRSARRIRDRLRSAHGVTVGIILSDTFGRPWRRGLVDVAIGLGGVAGLLDLRGGTDATGRELRVTEVAVADELAAAAELVMGKATGIGAAIVRGVDPSWLRPASTREELVRSPQDDLFR